jgi:RNA polymerase sigma factor (sigma-70 family)
LNAEINIQGNLLRKAAAGDDNARNMLYRQYSKAMFNICLRMTADRANAEDVLQDAFILAFKNLRQVKDENALAGWLRRIVVNECIRHTKKSIKWSPLAEDHEVADAGESGWFRDVSIEQLQKEINSLPDGCRQVFNLFVLEDFSHKEIAEALSISESTSKSQYQRARHLLKERILKQLVKYG